MIDTHKLTNIPLRLAVWLFRKFNGDKASLSFKYILSHAQNDALAAVEHYESELVLKTERLARRMDPAAALNEAANRAIEQRKEQGLDKGPVLTGAQKVALQFQAAYLKRVVSQ